MTKLEKQIQELESLNKQAREDEDSLIGDFMFLTTKAISIINQLKENNISALSENTEIECYECGALVDVSLSKNEMIEGLQAENLELREVVKKEMSISNELREKFKDKK